VFSSILPLPALNGMAMSHVFNLVVGVRQGGVLSPLFFAIFIDQLVKVASC